MHSLRPRLPPPPPFGKPATGSVRVSIEESRASASAKRHSLITNNQRALISINRLFISDDGPFREWRIAGASRGKVAPFYPVTREPSACLAALARGSTGISRVNNCRERIGTIKNAGIKLRHLQRNTATGMRRGFVDPSLVLRPWHGFASSVCVAIS
jgi:hypothetical protein